MPSSDLKNSVKNTIERYSMINKGDTVIAAVSGGADSVALLYVLYSLKNELGFSLAACHVNHNLRGEESDGDERFVRRMCRFLDIPLYVASIKVTDLRQKHDSLEECARRLRYEFFDSISRGKLIATAHTASDNCETILINMVRGTALSGICGIPVKRDNIIRPLLYNTRGDIERYCTENSLDYEGTYKGVFPAADCPGIETTLTLNPDKTFSLHSVYIDRDSSFDEKGTYTLKDNLLTLNEEGGELSYYKVEENHLRKLTMDKQEITGELADHYVLNKE